MSDPERYAKTLKRLNPILEPMVAEMLHTEPDDAVGFMISFLKRRHNIPEDTTEKEELLRLRQELARLKQKRNIGSASEGSEEEEDEGMIEAAVVRRPSKQRNAVSSEAFGKWNPKEDFVPRQIPKTAEQTAHIIERLSQSFMFASLDDAERDIVVQAMEERIVTPGTEVIMQGVDGTELFVVDSGTLSCYKVIAGERKFLKNYNTGDSFGELALLYNAPRAASIVADTRCVLWVLDRQCFNHIVKDSAIRRRDRYEEFLRQVELLENMDPYERSQLADCFKACTFGPGEFVIHEGEWGDVFYIVEEGSAIATKTLTPGQPPATVKTYHIGDYFGELALLRNEPRAANIIAQTQLKCVQLDRHSFKRMLGPLEDILKRNAAKYQTILTA